MQTIYKNNNNKESFTWAPVVIRLKVRDSATRPPKAMHIRSISSSGLYSLLSIGVYWANPKAWLVLGSMVTCPVINLKLFYKTTKINQQDGEWKWKKHFNVDE